MIPRQLAREQRPKPSEMVSMNGERELSMHALTSSNPPRR